MISKDELKKRVDSRWYGGLDGLHANFAQTFDRGVLPHGWVARSWAKDHAYYQANRDLCSTALQAGKTYDDSDKPLPMPK